MPQPSTYRATLCASLRNRNARQHFTGAALYGNWQKNAAAQIESRTRTHTLCEPAQSKCTSTFHRSHFIRKFTGHAAAQIEPRTRTHTLCKLAQSKCTSTFHKSHLIQKFKGKMPPPRLTHTHTPHGGGILSKSAHHPKRTARNFHQTRKKVRKQKTPPKLWGFWGKGFLGERKRYQTCQILEFGENRKTYNKQTQFDFSWETQHFHQMMGRTGCKSVWTVCVCVRKIFSTLSLTPCGFAWFGAPF